MKAESIVHTIFSQLGISVNRKQKHEYTCTTHLGEGRKEAAGEKKLQVRCDVGWSKENELVNGKVRLILLENNRGF